VMFPRKQTSVSRTPDLERCVCVSSADIMNPSLTTFREIRFQCHVIIFLFRVLNKSLYKMVAQHIRNAMIMAVIYSVRPGNGYIK